MDDLLKEAFECFIAECEEHIESATEGILALEREYDRSRVDAVFRSFHTIKGNSRMFELAVLPTLAHAAEELMASIRGGYQPGQAEISLLLTSLDSIKRLLREVAETGREAGSTEAATELAARLRAAAAASKPGAAQPTASSAAATKPEAAKTAAPAIAQSAAQSAVPPEAPPPAPAAPAALHNPPPQPSRSGATRPLSILIAEDDYLCRRTLQGMLKELGAIDIAADGMEAVEAFARSISEGVEHPYDLVCIDIMMPKLDGFEAVRSIRDLEMGAALKSLNAGASVGALRQRDSVILVTTSLDEPENYIKACYRCGANGYLVKPIDRMRLYAELERFALI